MGVQFSWKNIALLMRESGVQVPSHPPNGAVAQLVERQAVNLCVEGSSPSRPSIKCAGSSAGQSTGLRNLGSGVQIPLSAPIIPFLLSFLFFLSLYGLGAQLSVPNSPGRPSIMHKEIVKIILIFVQNTILYFPEIVVYYNCPKGKGARWIR